MDPTPVVSWGEWGILGAIVATLLPVIVYLYRRVERLQERLMLVTEQLHEKRLAESREVLKITHDSADAMEKMAETERALNDLIKVVVRGGSGGPRE